MRAFKVLRQNLTSLGLRAARHNPVRYKIGEWVYPQDSVSVSGEAGGLYVAPTLAAAKAMRRYFEKNYGKRTRIFVCQIGQVLRRTSCRIKTSKVKLMREIKE